MPPATLAELDQIRATIRGHAGDWWRIMARGPDGSKADAALVKMLACYALAELAAGRIELNTQTPEQE